MTPQTPLPLRWARLARVTGHLLSGMAIAAFLFRRLNQAGRHAAMRRWSHQLLVALNVTVRASGLPPGGSRALPKHCLLVCNHVSWLDILVLLSVCPATFVAKSEIRRWPLVGWLCAKVGTLFIERGRRRAARKTNGIVSAALSEGTLVCIFPEGTTTDGLGIARFHSALFQPAAEVGAMVQPMVLRYRDRAGNYCAAPNYVGDTSFLSSLWGSSGARHMVCELVFLTPLESAGRDRQEIARAAEAAVATELGVPIPTPPHAHARRSRPGTGDGLRAESR